MKTVQIHHFLMSLKERNKIIIGFSITSTSLLFLIFLSLSIFFGTKSNNLTTQLKLSKKQLIQVREQYLFLKNQDQYKINQSLSATISAIEKTFSKSVSLYQSITDLQAQKVDTTNDMQYFTMSLSFLSKRNYSSASATLNLLSQSVTSEQQKLATLTLPSPAGQPATASNTPPTSGYNVQVVSTDRGGFTVSIIAADMGSTRVVVDTASNGDCSNNCPVLPLDNYISRSSAYAGIDGNFFCPAEYPSCTGKTGSFDLLVMNKNKVYFNSSNNVYSTNPAVIFGNGFIRFVGQSLQWGRDTSVDGVISNFPLLVSGGNVAYSDSSDAKFVNKGTRGFVANKGNTVFIGYVFNANMTDAAYVLKALGMDNAMNLDEGGSTALWYGGGYVVGPGRNIPDAILFLRK